MFKKDNNTGYCNTGYCNTGSCNTGNWNTGSCNTGYCNTGYCNTGNQNTGSCNTGSWNTGYCNTGSYNSGNFNSGNFNSGFFNTDEPTVRLFNKDTGLTRNEIDIPYVNLKITEWIDESDMTIEQKKQDPDFHAKGGTLISRTYKDAWALLWCDLDSETKQKFLELPNFCPDIFEEITGIRVDRKDTCDGKIVEIDGKKYKLTEVYDE